MKLPLVVGNWKMNRTPSQSRMLSQVMVRDVGNLDTVEIVICPSFPALPAVADAIRDSNIALGAQNMHYERSGAFTGEISPLSLKELGCAYVILGHSERRRLFGETDEIVSRKTRAALENSLSPIVCLGETAAERNSGKTFPVLEGQFLRSVAAGLSNAEALTIAYEPVWAIGTGATATPEQAAEVHDFLRQLAARKIAPDWAESLRIIYGGSVTPENIGQLMARPEIDGVLVGGESLKTDSFNRICRFQAAAD